MIVERIPAQSYRRMRWLNGAGWTREIMRQPSAAEDFAWRVSIAEINRDGPFSVFPGCRREQCLLSGNGLTLDFEQGDAVDLLPPHDRHSYSAEVAVQVRLHDGPVLAFNLIARQALVRVSLLHRPLVGAVLFFPEPRIEWLLYLISGQAEFTGGCIPTAITTGDALHLRAFDDHRDPPESDSGGRVVMHGAGSALLCRIEHLK